jgi:Ca2+-binding RTX toxin-like protein
MASPNTLVANGDITTTDTSGYQILQTTDVTLTASQFAGFSSIVSNMSGTGGFIYGATGGTYDLEGKSTEPYTMGAQSNAGTTLIGNDANGEGLTASTSGADTLQAGNGTGDRLFAGGGTDKLIAGNGGDQLYIGGGVDTVIGGSGGDTFIIGQTSTYLSVAAGTTLQGGTGQDKLIVSSPIQDISGVNISGIETLQAESVTLTASQLAGFTMVTSGGSILPLSIYASTGGTYDLRGKSTEAFALNARSNAGTVLIGDDAGGQALRASASGNDTLQAGNGNGDLLYAGGGADRLIAGSGTGDQLYGGSGTDTFVMSNTGSATVTGGSGINIAVFAGNEASYSFSASLVSGGLKTTVTNKSTGVADTLTNVQTLQFADGSTDPLSAAGPACFEDRKSVV